MMDFSGVGGSEEFIEEFWGSGEDFDGAVGLGDHVRLRDWCPVVLEVWGLEDGEGSEAQGGGGWGEGCGAIGEE